jgi:hypothetical protein
VLVLVCSSVDLSALVLVSVGSLVAFLSLALVLASWAHLSLYSIALVVLLILYICWSVVVFVGTGGGTAAAIHLSQSYSSRSVVGLVRVGGGSVHCSCWWHWWWWRSCWWWGHSLFVLVAFVVHASALVLVALVLAAFVICGGGAGSAHVGAVRAGGVVPMMVFMLCCCCCYSSPIMQHWLVINLYVLSTHLSRTWLGIAAVIVSFIKPQKKDESAVLNSKQSDHCPT